MRGKKPDLLWVLVFLFGLGVVTTGYAQSFWDRVDNEPVQANYAVPLR
jgi:hypothetical protein